MPVPQPVTEAAPAESAPVVAEAEPKVFSDTLADGSGGPEMVRIPGGKFEMGSFRRTQYPDEWPRHSVSISAFAMGRYEITYAQYDRFAEATGRAKPDSGDLDRVTHPVAMVTWDDAVAYAAWLSEQTGHHYRLPSEAEWEYAAAAGTTSPFWWGYAVGKDNARCFDCGAVFAPTTPVAVGHFQANPFDLYDTAGNLVEWAEDCYAPNYNAAPTDGSAYETSECQERVARGGSFANASSAMRSAGRAHYSPETRLNNIGFRVARDL